MRHPLHRVLRPWGLAAVAETREVQGDKAGVVRLAQLEQRLELLEVAAQPRHEAVDGPGVWIRVRVWVHDVVAGAYTHSVHGDVLLVRGDERGAEVYVRLESGERGG